MFDWEVVLTIMRLVVLSFGLSITIYFRKYLLALYTAMFLSVVILNSILHLPYVVPIVGTPLSFLLVYYIIGQSRTWKQ